MLAFCAVSDGFLYLVLQRRLNLNTGLFPLLYVGTSLCYFLLAVPAGRLADRWGRGRVLLAGYALLAPIYVILLLPDLGFGRPGSRPAALRRLLRGDRRRPDGLCQRHPWGPSCAPPAWAC